MTDVKVMISGIQLQDGIDTASNLLRWLFYKLGAYGSIDRDYLSTIYGGKAGTTFYQGRFSDLPHACSGDEIADALIALEMGKKAGVLPPSAENYIARLKPGAFLIYDSSSVGELPPRPDGPVFVPVPAYKTAKQIFADEAEGKIGKLANSLLLGALTYLWGVDEDASAMAFALGKLFPKPDLVRQNLAAYEAGRTHVAGQISGIPRQTLSFGPRTEKCLSLSGNEAMAFGSLAAGEGLYAGYPITPATSILDFKEKNLRAHGGAVLQMEDEIASAAAVFGASFGGAVASTATSGPGFDLMTEMIGHAGMAEIPLVVVNVQRSGPSTGMPTKTEQSDLLAAIFNNHGEIPKIVLAPGDMTECYETMLRAYYLARKYRIVVVVLSALDIAEGWYTAPAFDTALRDRFDVRPFLSAARTEGEAYRPYRLGAPASQLAVPGQRDLRAVAMGTEHDERGFVSTNKENRTGMVKRRADKLQAFLNEDMAPPQHIGDPDADIVLVSWGSSKGPVIEARERLEAQGLSARATHVTDVWPLSGDVVSDIAGSAQKIFVVEGNATGQLAALMRAAAAEKGILLHPQRLFSILRYDGRPFEPRAIVGAVMKEVSHG